MTAIIVGAAFVFNIFVGAGVLAALDTKDQIFYNWYRQDPTGGWVCFLILCCWPVMAVLMIRYHLSEPAAVAQIEGVKIEKYTADVQKYSADDGGNKK